MSRFRDRTFGPGSGSLLDPTLEMVARHLLEVIRSGVGGKALYREVAGFADRCAEHLTMVNSIQESPADRRYAAAIAGLRHALDARLTRYECSRAAIHSTDIQRLVERWLALSGSTTEGEVPTAAPAEQESVARRFRSASAGPMTARHERR